MEMVLGVLALLGVGVGLGFVWLNGRVRWLLRSATRTEIGAAREHVPIVIVGTVDVEDRPLVAPISRRPCSAYVVSRGSDDGEDLLPVLIESKAVDFIVREDSGKAVVRVGPSSSVRIFLEGAADSWSSRDRGPVTPEVAALAKRAARPQWDRLQVEHMRLVEHVLLAGAHVVVAGVGAWEADPEPDPGAADYRSAPRRLAVAAAKHFPLIITDDPRFVRGRAG